MAFRDIVGHAPLLRLLSRAIARGSLPPSLILAGPEGVGKATVAVAVAQALNCEQPRRADAGQGLALEVDACGECGTCRRIAMRQFSEFLVLAPEDTGTIKIDPVREAIRRTGFRPFEGRRRVVWVHQADCLVPHAQNAFLKSLEEPGASTVFLLVTARPDVLLPTVRSRCPLLRFGLLAPAEVAEVLVRHHGWEASRASAAAAASGGSVVRALGSGEEGFEEAREVAERVLARIAMRRDARDRLDAAKLLADKKGGGRRSAARGPATDRAVVGQRLRAVGLLLRDLGVLGTGAGPDGLVNADRVGSLERIAPSYDARRAVAGFAAVDRALQALDRNVSPKVVSDWVVFQL